MGDIMLPVVKIECGSFRDWDVVCIVVSGGLHCHHKMSRVQDQFLS